LSLPARQQRMHHSTGRSVRVNRPSLTGDEFMIHGHRAELVLVNGDRVG